MILAKILYCLISISPVSCTESTAIEVRYQHTTQLECLFGSMTVIAADPRASDAVYAKLICGRPS